MTKCDALWPGIWPQQVQNFREESCRERGAIERERERVLINASGARVWAYGGWCCRSTLLRPACRSIYKADVHVGLTRPFCLRYVTNAAFAVVLQDHQNSFRPTISPITPPVHRVPCFIEITLSLEPILQIDLLPRLFPIFHWA